MGRDARRNETAQKAKRGEIPPRKNEKELSEISKEVVKGLNIITVERMEHVLKEALI